jgi:serine/threonine protein kinase
MLNDYVLMNPIGRGSFGKVVKAKHIKSGKYFVSPFYPKLTFRQSKFSRRAKCSSKFRLVLEQKQSTMS